MGICRVYRLMPGYYAIPVAVLASALASVILAALGVVFTDFLLNKYHADGPGAGVLVILVALNIVVPTFISVVSILINLHHQTSWLTPTLAFVLCVILIRMLGPFDVQFAPFMLSTGLLACLITCWFLRRREVSLPEHVL